MKKSLPVNCNIVGWIVDHMDNHSVTFMDIYLWSWEFSINRNNFSLIAQAFDSLVL